MTLQRTMLAEQQDDGQWRVVGEDGLVLAANLANNAAAWKWIDQHTDEGRDDTDRHNRIREAFSSR